MIPTCLNFIDDDQSVHLFLQDDMSDFDFDIDKDLEEEDMRRIVVPDASKVFMNEHDEWFLHHLGCELSFGGFGFWVLDADDHDRVVVSDGVQTKLAANLIALPRALR